MGVQSLDERSLESLERIHSAKKAVQAIHDAEKAGFENVSIDLMIDLPGQTEESLHNTLKQLENLPIQHLSLYNLTIEPHTVFYKRKVETPKPELSIRLLTITIDALERMGLKRYEISAFSRKGFESRHNLGYWTGREFLGFGPSAFSYWEKERFRNIPNLNRYAKALKNQESPVDFREKLEQNKHLNELLAVRLRLSEGVNLSSLAVSEETIKTIRKLKTLNLLEEDGQFLRLTDRGKLFYDTVAEEIV